VPGSVIAVQHVRRMRGGAQSHLMRCTDAKFYVVKFQNNPQHVRVLANELLATRLAERVGLSVPQVRVVEVTDWLVANTPELVIQSASQAWPCTHGLQFGARFVGDPSDERQQVFDYLPESALERVTNVREFAGMLCIDKWTCNTNGRQAVFSRKPRERSYRATFIDQGYCFNAGEWNFPDAAMRGVYARNDVYKHVRGWDDFEPWLSAVEKFDENAIVDCADGIPPEWCGDTGELERVLSQLVERRTKVRELIEMFKDCSRDPFPLWKKAQVAVQ
jgi:hypothetical protein